MDVIPLLLPGLLSLNPPWKQIKVSNILENIQGASTLLSRIWVIVKAFEYRGIMVEIVYFLIYSVKKKDKAL